MNARPNSIVWGVDGQALIIKVNGWHFSCCSWEVNNGMSQNDCFEVHMMMNADLECVDRSRLYGDIRAEVALPSSAPELWTAVLRPVEAMNIAIFGSSIDYLVKGYTL